MKRFPLPMAVELFAFAFCLLSISFGVAGDWTYWRGPVTTSSGSTRICSRTARLAPSAICVGRRAMNHRAPVLAVGKLMAGTP